MTITNQMKKVLFKGSALAVTTMVTVSMSLGVVLAQQIPNGTNNNPVPSGSELCNLDVGFVIDRSNSIRNDNEANPGLITSAVNNVVDGLQGTDSRVAVWSFGTKATGYVGANPLPNSPAITAQDFPGIGFTDVKNANGVNAIKQTVSSIPYESQNSPEELRRAGWTNWEAALAEANANGSQPKNADVVFMITDGDPTLPVADSTTQPTDRIEPAVAGVLAADAVKANGSTRIVAFAIGAATEDQAYIDNIKRITGGLNNAQAGQDYFTGNFAQLGTLLASAIEQACNDKPQKPVQEQPTVLPATGAAGLIAVFGGVSALSAATHALVARRRK